MECLKKLDSGIERILKIMLKYTLPKKIIKNLKIKKKIKKNIVGIDIKAELPKRPDIKIVNNFNQNKMNVANKLIKEINLKF